jgi:hypothetical protein
MWKLLDKIADWIPGRKESQRQTIRKLEAERDDLMGRPMDGHNYVRLQRVLEQLRSLRNKVQDAA